MTRRYRYFEGMVDRLSSQKVPEGEGAFDPDLMKHVANHGELCPYTRLYGTARFEPIG
jgi:hypothetical protein